MSSEEQRLLRAEDGTLQLSQRYGRQPVEFVRRHGNLRNWVLLITSVVGAAALFSVSTRKQTARSGQDLRSNRPMGDEMMISAPHRDGKPRVGESAPGPSVGGDDSLSDRPNIIFVLADDVGQNDLGRTSTDLGQLTPFLDKLATQSVTLTNYHTNEICTPSRASLMTGRDSFLTGMQYEVIQGGAPWGLPLDEVLLPERFRAAGYKTHMIGKWHLGMFKESYYPHNRGFDTFLGYLGSAETYSTHEMCEVPNFVGAEEGCWKDFGYGDEEGYIDTRHNTTRLGNFYNGKYSTTVIVDEAVSIARNHQLNHRDSPMFLYLPFQAAHDPVNPPEQGSFTSEDMELLVSLNITDPYRRQFSHVIHYLDKELSRMVSAFEDLGMMENTVLIFASDNGGCPTYGGSNYPYRGLKHTLYEGGTRVPAFVYSKTLIPEEARGTNYDGLMHSMDWTPTLGSLARFPVSGLGKPLSGVDQWKGITGEWTMAEDGPLRDEVVLGRTSYVFDSGLSSLKSVPPRGAYIYKGWKILVGVRCSGWYSFEDSDAIPDAECDSPDDCVSCVLECNPNMTEDNNFLFNLDADPYETHNLIHDMPAKFADLLQRWNHLGRYEVVPGYVLEVSSSVKKWNAMNGWMVAWVDDD